MKFAATTTKDNLPYLGLLSPADDKKTIIIHIHGMQGDFYDLLPPYYQGYPKKNISFLAGETRGSYIIKQFPSSSGVKTIGGAYEIFEDCVQDIHAWISYAEKEGFGNIWLSSHSLSPAKVAYYLYKTADPRVKGIIFMSPSDNVGLVKDPIGAADHEICFPEAQELINQNKGHQLLPHDLWGDKVFSATTYINLFSDSSASNIFHYHNPDLSWQIVNSISVPVIAFTGSEDDGINPVIDPTLAMDMLKRQLIHSPNVQTHVFQNAQHSFKGFEENIIDNVSEFILSV